ncbi:MAG: FliA/WhiG family RNA polymerase sigma factor [Acidobacteria bacterium]|nr:FliA/WhiG family RNA polymerase sigma factor [Acidobacteriota bacterium]
MATQTVIPPAAHVPATLSPLLFWKEPRPKRHDDSSLKKGMKGRAEIDRTVVALLPLVKRVAMQMRERLPAHVELDDLISTGVLGLVDAVHKFDADKEVKLEQYAQHRIRGAILDGLREQDTASRDMRRKNKHAEQVYGELEAKLGRTPNDLEMAKALGMSLARWYRTVLELRAVGVDWLRPLASVGTQESAFTLADSIPAENEGHQFDACYQRERKEILAQALGRIPERERQVVELYYREELTMREIGERLGIDESRVSQLHSTAIERLRRRVTYFLSHPVLPMPRFAW